MIQLQHPQLSDFEPFLRQCFDIAHTSGIGALTSIGHKMNEIRKSRGLHRKFIRGCHYGFDLAQRKVGAYVGEVEGKISSLETELRTLRRTREQGTLEIVELIKVLQARQLVLRRLVDSIAAAILHPNEWAMKHLSLEDKIKRVEPKNLALTVQEAARRNKSDRMKFNLVCDLTTGIHIGDLIEVDRSAMDKRSWELIELKEGKVNAILTNAIEEKHGELAEEDLNHIKATLGEKAEKQAKRMLRQRSRQTEIRRMVEGTEGVSPQYNVKVALSESILILDDYSEAVRTACREAHKGGFSAFTVNGCLYILAVKPEKISGLEGWAAVHLFHHMGLGGGICLLNDPERRGEEIAALKKGSGYVDLVVQNISDTWGYPIFTWMEHDRVMDLVMGRIRLFVQFDMNKFFELAKSEGVELRWVTGRPSAGVRKLSVPIPGSPNAWSVHAKFADGTEFDFLGGIFRRAVTNLTSPSELIKLMKRYPEIAPESGQVAPASPAK